MFLNFHSLVYAPITYFKFLKENIYSKRSCNVVTVSLRVHIMERLYMEAQDGLKTIAPPLFLNIFFYFLLV